MTLKLISDKEQSLQYFLLPSANPPPHLVGRHNQIYQFWKKTWQGVLAELKADPCQLEAEFVRQDLIAGIFVDSEVAVVHLYSFFAIDALAAREHPYMTANYPADFFTRLQEAGVRTAMSMEYLTVNPAWRKTKTNLHLGAVMGTMAQRVMQHYQVDATIAPCRRDHKINEMAYSLGGECVVEEVTNHNVLCDLVMIKREKLVPFPDAKIEGLKNELWSERVHFESTQVSAIASLQRKAA